MIYQAKINSAMMIFSVLYLFLSFHSASSQEKYSNAGQIQAYEAQVLGNLDFGNQYDMSYEHNSPILQGHARGADQLKDKSKRFSAFPHQNSIQLYMQGTKNQVQAEQIQGINNYMDLGLAGTSNKGTYLQQGSNNYIFDRISGEGVTRDIQQIGDGLGIYNQGIPTLPMKIHQQGKGTKLLIK